MKTTPVAIMNPVAVIASVQENPDSRKNVVSGKNEDSTSLHRIAVKLGHNLD